MKYIYHLKRITFSVFIILISYTAAWAQVPANYYDNAGGLSGSALEQELHDILTNGHSAVSYTPGVWDAFHTTDVYPSPNETIIWDMYSAKSNSYDGTADYYFTIGTDQDSGSGGTDEGQVYNREHSFPKSWFGGGGSPQETDLHHVYASDKFVNNKRSSFPYGENNGEALRSSNGSKLGSCTLSGYSGSVFEPIDIYKGDFARMLFYMATRYKDEIPTWVSNNSGSGIEAVFQSTGEFQTWHFDMLLSWHEADPVSQKEINRNNAVYNIQGNANPFIDHPEWVCEVWSSSCGPTISASPVSITGYSYSEGSGPSASQNFSVSGSNLDGSNITITGSENYEVSLDDTNFGASQSITTMHGNYDGTVLSATTVYIRLKAGLNVAAYNSENVTVSGGGATDIYVVNSGEVTEGSSSLSSISEKDGIQIFPNPAKDRLLVNSAERNINKIRIADIGGKIVMRKNVSCKQIEIALNTMDEGVYFIEIQTDSYISTKIFIKQ